MATCYVLPETIMLLSYARSPNDAGQRVVEARGNIEARKAADMSVVGTEA